jgi:cell division inhibitor SulA
VSASPDLTRLLEHPALWRGNRVARADVVPSGFASLDARLPGGGWPRTGLIEILMPHFGIGELTLLLPALSAFTRAPSARWCAWVQPPLQPFAPALAAHGIVLNRILVIQSGEEAPRLAGAGTNALWALEQCLGSGACDVVLGWARDIRSRDIRRLQLAAERGRTLGILFRPLSAARHASHAILRLELTAAESGLRGSLLKSRGGLRGSFDLPLSGRT